MEEIHQRQKADENNEKQTACCDVVPVAVGRGVNRTRSLSDTDLKVALPAAATRQASNDSAGRDSARLEWLWPLHANRGTLRPCLYSRKSSLANNARWQPEGPTTVGQVIFPEGVTALDEREHIFRHGVAYCLYKCFYLFPSHRHQCKLPDSAREFSFTAD